MKTKEEIRKLILMFQTIFLRKWTENFPTPEILEIASAQWQKGLAGIENEAIQRALDYCRVNMEWPPSIAEFISHCERESGVPTLDGALALALRREFPHPIVKVAFDLVGSWAMSNDSEKILKAKFKNAYAEALTAYRKMTAQKSLGSRELENG